MKDIISGRYFTVGANASVDATLRKRENQAIITLASDEGASFPTRNFSTEIAGITDRLANVARKITLKDGSVFETFDNDAVDEIFDIKSSFFNRLSRVEGSFKLVAIIAVCTLLVLVGMYRYGLPALANGAAKITPSGVLTLMDKGTLITVDKVLFNASKLSETRKQEITDLFAALAKYSDQTAPPLRLLFRDGAILGANAIALPGGSIIITDQLVALAKSPDEIAGVLAHEIGHVELRHSLRQIYRVLGIGFMITVIGGDSSQLMEDVITQAAALESLSYSRKFETESDQRSVEIMIGLKRDPLAFIELLKRITQDSSKKSSTSWFDTHPGTFDRLSTLKKYINTIEQK